MPFVGQMTPEEVKAKTEEVLRRLKTKGVPANCPRCGKNEWQVDLLGYFVSSLPVAGVGIPPPHVPVLNLTCTNCGSTQLHNLKALDIEV